MTQEGEGTRFPKMCPQDDPEGFLEAFEHTAMTLKWNLARCAVRLGPLLIGPAQAAYRALTRMEAWDYGKVKAIILYQLEISPRLISKSSGLRKRWRSLDHAYWPRV